MLHLLCYLFAKGAKQVADLTTTGGAEVVATDKEREDLPVIVHVDARVISHAVHNVAGLGGHVSARRTG